MMTAPRPVTRQRPVFQQPWNGSVNKNGLPVIKGVGEVQSAARMQDWRAKGSLYGDVPTSAQVAEQVQDRAAADQVKRQDAFARGYENYKRKMGAGAQPEVQSINLSDTERRRKNLIAGGAQPLQADAAIKQEQFAAQKAAMKPQPAAPATGPSLGADAAATSVLDMPAPAVAKPVATINDGGQTMPMGDWIKAKKSQQMVQPTVTAPVVGPPHILRTGASSGIDLQGQPGNRTLTFPQATPSPTPAAMPSPTPAAMPSATNWDENMAGGMETPTPAPPALSATERALANRPPVKAPEPSFANKLGKAVGIAKALPQAVQKTASDEWEKAKAIPGAVASVAKDKVQMGKAIPGAIENVARDHISALKNLAKPYVEDFNKGLQGMAKGGRKPDKGPILAGEEGNELKINDDETMEPIHGPQIMQGGKPGVIIPNKALKDLKKKFDKPIKGKKAAFGGRVPGDANAFGPAGVGGTTTIMPPPAPKVPAQPVSFGDTTEQPTVGYGPPRR